VGFSRSLAWVIGIDAYSGGVTPLRTAGRDAGAIAETLGTLHDYEVCLLTDGEAGRDALITLFEETLPASVGPDDRLVLYFAGHGIAQDGDDGPEGFLVPVDARANDRDGLLSMVRVQRALEQLPCRHLLLVLDCCFAGSFRWASTRSFLPTSQPLTRKRYQRFLDDPAWQVLTSSADDQKALDVLDGLTIGARPVEGEHSPFAQALLDGLRGGADRAGADGQPDGVVTAAELYGHVRDIVELGAEEQGKTQTPGLWPLPRHGRGEFLFTVPGQEPNLRPDPVLDEAANPWRGLASYEAEHAGLFFGRQRVVDALEERLQGEEPMIAVLGASGTGKSSVVKAGLLPWVASEAADRLSVIGPLRPGTDPARALARIRRELSSLDNRVGLVVIDQFEEVWTMCREPAARDAFLSGLARDLDAAEGRWRLLITARSDFGPQLAGCPLGARLDRARFVVPAFETDELRDIITGPAQVRVLYFEPPELVEALVNEVVGVPGALPLLSFTLSELYRAYIAREADDRALLQEDYDALGGVVGALRPRASALYSTYDLTLQATVQRVMLRLLSTDGGELAKRRATLPELNLGAGEERVIRDFVQARLLVQGSTGEGQDAQVYVEPAHDMLVIAWDLVHLWLDRWGAVLPLVRALWIAASSWGSASRDKGLLWHEDPRLPQALALASDAEPVLNQLEDEFIRRSARRKQRQRRNSMLAVAAFVAVILVGAGAALFYAIEAGERAREAEDALAIARDKARVVAAEQLSIEPWLAIALLRETDDPSTPGWMKVATALGQRPPPLALVDPPLSHVGEVREARFGPGPTIYAHTAGGWLAWEPRANNRVAPIDEPPPDARPAIERPPDSDGRLRWDGGAWVMSDPSTEPCHPPVKFVHPDGTLLFDASDELLLWHGECRTTRGNTAHRWGFGEPLVAARVDETGRWLGAWTQRGLHWIDLETGEHTRASFDRDLPPPEEPPWPHLAVDAESKTVAAQLGDGSRAMLWAGGGQEGARWDVVPPTGGSPELFPVVDPDDRAWLGRVRDIGPRGVTWPEDMWGRPPGVTVPWFYDGALPLLRNLPARSASWSRDRRTLAAACAYETYIFTKPQASTDRWQDLQRTKVVDGSVELIEARLDPDATHLVTLRQEGWLSVHDLRQEARPIELWRPVDRLLAVSEDAGRIVVQDTRGSTIELLELRPDRVLDDLWWSSWLCPTAEERVRMDVTGPAASAALNEACWARVGEAE